MVRRTYVNDVNEVEVSLAIERLLLAPYPASWTPARIDLDSLPSGFADLGAVKEDTPVVRTEREKYELKTGLPKITQYQSIIGVTGQLEATLLSNSWRKLQVALGNYTATCSPAQVGTISSVTSSGLIFTLLTTPTTPMVVGQQIIISASGQADAIDAIEVRIGSITSNNQTFVCGTAPIKTITANMVVSVYGMVKQILGGKTIRNYHLLGVSDFIDGVQIVHEFKKCQSAGNWEEMFRPDNVGMIPLTFDALGYRDTIGGCTELVLGARYYFPPLDATCV